MTKEEKQKAINALKISAPVMAVTQEEFNDYIQTLNKVMDWLEQEPILDKILDEVCDIDDEIVLNSDSLFERKAYVRLNKVMDIIDKYKSELEDWEE